MSLEGTSVLWRLGIDIASKRNVPYRLVVYEFYCKRRVFCCKIEQAHLLSE